MASDREREARRSSIMEQRLRRARGEESDDDLEADTERYLARQAYLDDDEPPPRYRNSGGGGRRSGGGGGGCAQAVLYLVLGGLAAMLLMTFFFNRTLGGIGEFFSGATPDFGAMIETPTPEIVTGVAVIERIQQLSRLESSSYTIERVIDVSQGSNIPIFGNFLAGDAILLIAHGTVIAGFDLGKLTPDDVIVSPDGQQVTVRLPPAEVFSSALDNSRTRVYSRDRGIFAPTNQDLETLARQTAEREILAAACEGGIMQAATENGIASMRQLLSLSGFETIIVEAAPAQSCPPIGP